MATPLNVIPARLVRRLNDQPANHCSVRQVKSVLRGNMNLVRQQFQGEDGSLTDWEADLHDLLIPEVTADVVKRINQPMDWCRAIYFFDGPAGESLSLPYRYIYDVNLCYLRVLPSLPFYAFQRIRNVDGTEFDRILGVEPQPTPPMIVPPTPITAQYASSLIWTGVEDADLFVDTRARELRIPPRVLIAGVSLPMANFQFLRGTMNVEVHFRFGYPPTKYEDGTPLKFDTQNVDANGNYPLIQPSASGSPVDWSSGMPAGFSMAVARLVANKVRRQLWRGVSSGLSSQSVEGASESYGGTAFGGDLDREDEQIYSDLEQYGITIVI